MSSPLPNETLSAIFENVQPHALTHLLRVSRRFSLIAERILYSTIVIFETLPRSAPVPYKTARCCKTILQRPHLAEVVKKFSIRWQTDSGPRDEYMPTISPRGILDECGFPALRVFALSGVGRGSLPAKFHPTPTPPIEWFLAATPSILHLRLTDYHEPMHLTPGDLPHLASFRGPAIAAGSVLPGRPVQLLGLVGHEFVTVGDLARMAQTSAPLRRLDLSAMSVTPLLLRDVAAHLSGVVSLRVRLALRHTLHFSLSGIVSSPLCPLPARLTLGAQSLLAGLTPVLGAFAALRELDLSPTSIDGIGPGNALEEQTLCATWGRGCPSLHQVIFPSKTEWTLSPEHVWIPHPAPSYSRS
ncbi:hypothetical protein A0H81_13125 [Grifola frondosa]|uniref:F-box domain-containing protein n=1 Tax=Grifola frondosa TaxID=5627 RepID=A0A1C7LQF8_GRIFR|nr:hypothetical protein A0H81_13125 [Grifola frondosa]